MKRAQSLNNDLKSQMEVSKTKLKNILSQESNDSRTFIDILLNKDSISEKDFISSMNRLIEYLKAERATQLQKGSKPSKKLTEFIDEQRHNKIYILHDGALENYFERYKSDKIENALEIVKKHPEPYPAELVDIFKQIIEDR